MGNFSFFRSRKANLSLITTVIAAVLILPATGYGYNRNDALKIIKSLTPTWEAPKVESWINDFRGNPDGGIYVNEPVVFKAESTDPGYFLFLFVDAKGEVALFKPGAKNPDISSQFDGLTQAQPLGEQFLYTIATAREISSEELGMNANAAYKVVGASTNAVEELADKLTTIAAVNPMAISGKYSYFVDGDTKLSVRGMNVGVKREIAQVRPPVVKQPVEVTVERMPTAEETVSVASNEEAIGASTGMVRTSAVPRSSSQVSSDGISLDIKFKINDSSLTDAGRRELDVLGNTMVGLQSSDTLPVIVLVGHTDSSGEEDYNMQLSDRRANAAKDYLTSTFGLPENSIFAEGMGESLPVKDNSTAAGRAQNRRVVLKVQQ
ncbi:hypothetical protein AB833_28195 [Chromatiales bacterium (ex Bugula neritina AB1)]|nr:hypothetical protein AB833_28195 [Chromatiales bacterium (ex Bugula neritina AB1)]